MTADPNVPVPKQARRFYRGDDLYALLWTLHQGIERFSWIRMKFDGRLFVGRLTVPAGCSVGAVYLVTNEGHLNLAKQFLAFNRDGKLAPGARIAGMARVIHDRKNWKEDIEAEMADPRERGWLHQQVWGLRHFALGNLSREELMAEVTSAEKEKESDALLRSLAYGFFVAGQPDRAFQRLASLCRRFPESPHVPAALHDAHRQAFSHGWKDVDPKLYELRAEVIRHNPENPELWRDPDAVTYLRRTPGITIADLRQLCSRWMAEQPESMEPFLVLAHRLVDEPGALDEAESLATRSVELSYRPAPNIRSTDYLRGQAYRLRARFERKRETWSTRSQTRRSLDRI